MRFKEPPEIIRTRNGFSITFNVPEDEIDNLYAIANSIQEDKEYDLLIRKRSQKRSIDANAYAWKLISLLSAEVGLTPIEVYQQQILNMYTYRDVLVKNDDVQKEINDWKKQGVGWLCEIVGPSREHKNYTWVRKFKGSSSFSSEEMSRFIDNIIFEAKEFGIQTEPPYKVKELKEKWGLTTSDIRKLKKEKNVNT